MITDLEGEFIDSKQKGTSQYGLSPLYVDV